MLYNTKNVHGGDVYEQNIILDYSANTNPFGTPEGVKKAIISALGNVHLYPDPYCRSLVRAIAEFEGVEESMILCGNGAAELIYAFARALSPRTAAETAPTFSEYSLGLSLVGTEVFRYFLSEENDFILTEGIIDFLSEKNPDVLYLCNPNNPTGQLIPTELLERILSYCREKDIRVFLDECFLDLTDCGVSMKKYLTSYPNLLILKAFTKSFGMAGLRLGYCLCSDKELLTEMSAVSQPWNVSIPAQAAGSAATKEIEFLNETLRLIASEKPYLAGELASLGYRVIPSSANYILFKGAPELGRKLREKGIALRFCNNYYGLGEGWYRIAVKLPKENRKLIETLKSIKTE